ncbi:MAG: tRNA (N(6)-L-threonylcarbamoyladenosine(37)-C(2))-methylthiotransferase MtaB [Oscillospiraceae bacterium]|jgi:threonylcarbamoyladenosine tRNA methylthiotransferase MtaB|nr:tRNA (N(6)-L-threonylcarbamoyladenosine(37)-C(2))-methylthiotransferase MtaB [Oscillospiraceae bacterium]
MARTVAFCTLGCKVNQYDAQAMLEALMRAGYESVDFNTVADVYVVNTCTVTGTGDQKSRQMIRRAARKNPEAAIVVAGCMAQRAAREVAGMAGVRLVLGTQRRGEIAVLLEQALQQTAPLIAVEALTTAYEDLPVSGSEGRTRATLKIQEGCQNHCAYCVIPSVRGPVRSRTPESVRQQAQRLADAGFQEIVLTGIHLGSYGLDLGEGVSLIEAIRAAHEAEGVSRIRLGSLEPGAVTDAFVDALKALPKVCPQFMLALQSGSDSVLARMGRRYDTAAYRRAVQRLRAAYPDCALTTDVMTGFPGETEGEFQQTLDFVREMGFARIHVFPYSARAGTRAAQMPDQVPIPVREARAAKLIELGESLAEAYAARWVGRRATVLFETARAGGAEGYTPEYLRVWANGQPGMLQTVAIMEADGEGLRGKIIVE